MTGYLFGQEQSSSVIPQAGHGALAEIYVQGLLSDLLRKNAEAIALEFMSPRPRTGNWLARVAT
jgi:hypothetical protein